MRLRLYTCKHLWRIYFFNQFTCMLNLSSCKAMQLCSQKHCFEVCLLVSDKFRGCSSYFPKLKTICHDTVIVTYTINTICRYAKT